MNIAVNIGIWSLIEGLICLLANNDAFNMKILITNTDIIAVKVDTIIIPIVLLNLLEL